MNKIILTSIVIVGSMISVYSQSGAKWATNGNTNATGDFLGTTNNFPLDFKTNNILRMSLGANGVLKLSALAGSNTRLLQVDANGNIISLPQGTANQYLSGTGTWVNVPSVNNLWLSNGSSLYFNTGYVGIGTNNPLFPLDVIGDARITNNLYVGGGVVISDKVKATTEVKGWDIKVDNDLSVESGTRLKGATRIDQGFTFDGANGISHSQINNVNVFHYGNTTGAKPLPLNCAAAPYSGVLNQFGGWLQIYDPSNPTTSGLLNLQTWSGGSSIDASVNAVSGTGSLLLNYFCGNNTFINTGANGGKVSMGQIVEVGMPITDNSVALNIKVNGSQDDGLQVMNSASVVNFKVKNTGFVYAREVNVQIGPFPDYVFKKGYNLLPLEEVESFIKINNHLKGFEKAEYYNDNGIELGEIVRLQQEKIEELTLYMIQLKKEIEKLKNGDK